MLRLAVADQHVTRLVSPRHLKAVIEAERTGVPFLYWLDDQGEQHVLMLSGDPARVTIGRREQSDVPLSWDLEVSRAHALLDGRSFCLPEDVQAIFVAAAAHRLIPAASGRTLRVELASQLLAKVAVR